MDFTTSHIYIKRFVALNLFLLVFLSRFWNDRVAWSAVFYPIAIATRPHQAEINLDTCVSNDSRKSL